MRIRILAVGAALAAVLAIPAIPAIADEGSATSTRTVTEELEPGAAGPGAAPSPTSAALPSDLGWG
ncbi:hypothetical protein [Streptomyces sp. NPDC048565]|uniref:hypothetical protein n=1 Tax=Streptomyces sp. NPDC048565 TaxID=3155266 RepID=UPI003440E2DF